MEPSTQALRALIDEAFHGVELGVESPTVQQAIGVEDSGHIETQPRDHGPPLHIYNGIPNVLTDNRTDWKAVADGRYGVTEQHTLRRLLVGKAARTAYPFCFFDANATRFHLPAAMVVALDEREREGTVFDIEYFSYQLFRQAIDGEVVLNLSDQQRRAVVGFAEHARRIEQRERDRLEKAGGDGERRREPWDAEDAEVEGLPAELRAHLGMRPDLNVLPDPPPDPPPAEPPAPTSEDQMSDV